MPVAVLLARQRSGTGAFGSILDQHEDIRYLGEVFHPHGTDRWPNYFQFEQQIMHENTNFMLPGRVEERFDRYLKWIEEQLGGKTAVLDIKYRSTHHFSPYWQGLFDPPYVLKMLKERGIPIIHLTRKNFLKTYISGKLAEENKIWHATNSDDVKITELIVDIEDMMRHLERTNKEVIRMGGILKGYKNTLSLDYSGAFDEKGRLQEKAARNVGDFLIGSPLVERGTPYVKQTPDALKEVINNYPAVSKALEGTPYKWMSQS